MNSPSVEADVALARKNPLPMIIVLFGCGFMAAFNENLINVALISIMDEFSVSTDTAQWLVTGYMVITTIVVAMTAFLFRRFRLRRLLIFGLLLIMVGSMVCMFAPLFPVLLVSRLVQAIGTGICIPSMMNTILVVTPRKKLGTYLAVGNCMIVFGPALAPVVSGLMVTMISWRAIFIPPAACALILVIFGLIFVRNIADTERIHLDIVSVILAAVGLFLFVYGLSIITTDTVISLIFLVVGIIFLVFFARRQFGMPMPFLNLKPLRNPLFLPVCLMMIVIMMTSFSMGVLLPLYFEGALGMTSLLSGAMLIIPVLINGVTSVVGGRIMDRHGSWPLIPIGFGVVVIGQVLIFATALEFSWVLTLVGSMIVYAGVGSIFATTQTAGLQILPDKENPDGVALINIFVQMAASIGPSLFVGILSSTSAAQIASGATDAFAQANGFSSAILVAAVIALAGFILAFIYARVRHVRGAIEPDSTEQVTHPELSVASVMKEPYMINEHATVRDAMMMFVECRVSGLTVVDDRQNVVGFVTDGDVLKALGRSESAFDLSTSLALYRDLRSFDVRMRDALAANIMDIATTSVISVSVDDSIDDICATLSEKGVKKVPVLDRHRLVGTISRSDIVRQLMSAFASESENALPETAETAEVVEEPETAEAPEALPGDRG